MRIGLFSVFILLLALCSFAEADVGLMLDGSVGVGMSELTGAGHASIYLSRACPETPVKLRTCAPGEQGSVISNYEDFGERAAYDWNVVPLSVFLYGVEDARQRPLIATLEMLKALRERQRVTRLRGVCGETGCPDTAHWRDQIGEALIREIYVFAVSTTPQQDEAFIEKFNARANLNRYNGFTRNCADFAREVMNLYFPGSTHADYLNDFFITSPKAISRSFTHYSVERPALDFHVVRYAQLPGAFRHSDDPRHGTEVSFRSARWLLLLLTRPHELTLFAATYAVTGRFNPYHELQRRPSIIAGNLIEQRDAARRRGDHKAAHEVTAQLKAERVRLLGDDAGWDAYRARFQELLRSAIADGVIERHEDLHRFLSEVAAFGHTTFDAQGSPWLEITERGAAHRIGLTRGTVLAAGSDRALASRLLLTRMDAVLHQKKKYREPWEQTVEDQQMADALFGPAIQNGSADVAEAGPWQGHVAAAGNRH
ncbi:MAG: hypothetical protein ABI383_12390 [Acidobacteriaceae bacterium]